jgi:hypothetical protein
MTDRLDEAAAAIDHIRQLGPPIASPHESRESDWNIACDRCRAQILALRLQAPHDASAMERVMAAVALWELAGGRQPNHANDLCELLARAIEQAEAAARAQVKAILGTGWWDHYRLEQLRALAAKPQGTGP